MKKKFKYIKDKREFGNDCINKMPSQTSLNILRAQLRLKISLSSIPWILICYGRLVSKVSVSFHKTFWILRKASLVECVRSCKVHVLFKKYKHNTLDATYVYPQLNASTRPRKLRMINPITNITCKQTVRTKKEWYTCVDGTRCFVLSEIHFYQ